MSPAELARLDRLLWASNRPRLTARKKAVNARSGKRSRDRRGQFLPAVPRVRARGVGDGIPSEGGLPLDLVGDLSLDLTDPIGLDEQPPWPS